MAARELHLVGGMLERARIWLNLAQTRSRLPRVAGGSGSLLGRWTCGMVGAVLAGTMFGCPASRGHPNHAANAQHEHSDAALDSDANGSAAGSKAASDVACAWPASLNDPDAPRGACQAARALLKCSSGGTTQICLSSDPIRCPGMDGFDDCQNQCAAGEYAIGCGAIGPDPGTYSIPEGCHGELRNPGGSFMMCCACASAP